MDRSTAGATQPVSPAPAKETEAAANPDAWTISRILAWTTEHLRKHGSESPRLESEILLAHARKCQRIQLYTHYNEIVDESTRAQMRELVKRRVQREPVAYLVGHREFYSLDFLVQPGVFIPRPETETLVTLTLEKLANLPQSRVLELCVGSGCISVAVAVRQPRCQVTGVDLNPLAVEVAGKNAARHQVAERVQILQGNLFSALPENEPFDVLVSNPPYVCTQEIPELAPEIAQHEPHLALDGGADGLDAIRQILSQAPRYLKPGGWCLLEMDPAQIEPVLQLAEQSQQWTHRSSHVDLFGLQRCVSLQRKA